MGGYISLIKKKSSDANDNDIIITILSVSLEKNNLLSVTYEMQNCGQSWFSSLCGWMQKKKEVEEADLPERDQRRNSTTCHGFMLNESSEKSIKLCHVTVSNL